MFFPVSGKLPCYSDALNIKVKFGDNSVATSFKNLGGIYGSSCFSYMVSCFSNICFNTR